MKKPDVEMKNDGKEFERFDDLLRHIVSVPKDEINKREKADKERKRDKKNEARK